MLEEEEDIRKSLFATDLDFSAVDLEMQKKDESTFIEKPMESESHAEIEMGRNQSLFGQSKVPNQFYMSQFNMLYNSGISIEGRDVDDIIEDLRKAAEQLKPRPRQFTKEQLGKIRTEPQIEPNLFAKDIAEELETCNGGNEFRNLGELKDLVSKKRKDFFDKTVDTIKNDKKVYKDLDVELKLEGDEPLKIDQCGKQIELVCDYIGQVYIICKQVKSDGPHITIFELDIETGQISEAILNEALVENIKFDKSIKESLQKSVHEKALSEAASKIESMSQSGKKVSRIAAWLNDEETEIIRKEEKDEEIKVEEVYEEPVVELKKEDIKNFNKIWTKRGEFIYFFKIVNDANKEDSELMLMRFNLTTKQFIQIKSTWAQKQTVIVHNNEGYKKTFDPYGVNAVVFQETSQDEYIQSTQEISEPLFLDRQFVLLIGDQWKAFSFRKLTDLEHNLLYFESSLEVSWHLYKFDKERGNPYSDFAIGGLQKCKTYIPMTQGYCHQLNQKEWIFNIIDLDEQSKVLGDVSTKYKCINNQVYSLYRNDDDQVLFQKEQMKDYDHKCKLNYLDKMKLQYFPEEMNTAGKKNFYLNQHFAYNTFFILQDLSSDKTWLLYSYNGSNQIKLIQLKSKVQDIICRKWNLNKVHPITKMQYRYTDGCSHLVQVHPLFYDILSNGEKFISFTEQSLPMTSRQRVFFKPKYYEEYYDDLDTQFSSELPTIIFQSANDDRKVIPRMGIEEKQGNSLTYLDIHEYKENKTLFGDKLQKQVRLETKHSTIKRIMLINAWRYGWKNLEISGQYRLTGFQPSSSIQLIDEEINKFMQNWQMLIMDRSQLFFWIFEYKFQWCENINVNPADIKNYRLTYLGKTLVILQKPWLIHHRLMFLPYYPDSRNSLIAGTQIIPEYNSPQKLHLIFNNQGPNDVQFKTDLSNCSYKILKNSKRKMTGFMIKARLTNNLVHKYSDTEKNLIFDSQLRVMANLLIEQTYDIDRFTKDLLDDTFKQQDKILFNNRPQEQLNGMSAYEYIASTPSLYTKMRSETFKSQVGQDQPSLLNLIHESWDKQKRERYAYVLETNLPIQFELPPNQMSDDLFYNNQLYRCYENISRKLKSCQNMIIHALSQPNSPWIQMRFMQILPFVIKTKQIIPEWGHFLMDYDGRDKLTCFAIKLSDADLPDFGGDDQTIRQLDEKIRHSNMDISLIATQQIIRDSIQEGKEKSIPNQHFIVDFRSMLLQNKIRLQLQDSQRTQHISELTEYDLHYYIYRIVKLYGKKIEMMDTVRAIIDEEFYERTQVFFYSQFFGFCGFFIAPFLFQLFYSGNRYIILGCHISCIVFASWLSVNLRMFYSVNGWKKTWRNAQNMLNMTFILTNWIYIIPRVKELFEDPSKPLNSQLPKAHVNDQPTFDLFFNILFTCGISFQCALKLSFYLRVNENYGNLSRLIFRALVAITPLTIFIFIWLIIAIVLYKVMGGNLEASQSYTNVPEFFGYFFYNFVNAVGNPNNPSFKIWRRIQINEEGKPWTYRKYLSKIMIYAIYWIWFTYQIFIQIILLNFLIAVIMSSYDQAIENEIITTYLSKAELNREYLIIQKALKRDPKIGTLLLSANTEDESISSQWYKFTQQVKGIMRQKMNELKKEVTKQQDSLEDKFETAGQNLIKESQTQHELLINQLHQLANQTQNLK